MSQPCRPMPCPDARAVHSSTGAQLTGDGVSQESGDPPLSQSGQPTSCPTPSAFHAAARGRNSLATGSPRLQASQTSPIAWSQNRTSGHALFLQQPCTGLSMRLALATARTANGTPLPGHRVPQHRPRRSLGRPLDSGTRLVPSASLHTLLSARRLGNTCSHTFPDHQVPSLQALWASPTTWPRLATRRRLLS